MDKINLFCFPFAGGSSYSYQLFKGLINRNIELLTLELPGRGTRMQEPLLRDLNQIAGELMHALANRLNQPYALYGHSMGALLGFLVTKRIIKAGLREPLHLFVSGCRGPSVKLPNPPLSALSSEELIMELKEMGGSPNEVLEEETFYTLFEPILRADFQAVETYRYEESEPMAIPLTAMFAVEDDITEEEVMAWQRETVKRITLKRFTGKHFFIFNHQSAITRLINHQLVGQRKDHIGHLS
ncbi:alpha/beta fold hydrolase [Fulvivirgaceae bacterium BMA12]|uniref:Alpha/beta fold hydrolase n=1 Tax=Agaribacillus aureus TaxID=3051825 RepID=A0ABT8LI67_9BACT|nr:alpha/beta fold hydrolase [Fulvivirgaceae bacterium BMA12]